MSHLLYALTRRDEAGPVATTPVAVKDPGPLVTGSIWAMFAVATVFLALRVYCRGIRVRAMWWDDYLLILGWAFLLAASALITELMRLGFGLTLLFQPHMHTLSTTSDVVNKLALALTKTSFAVTLLRVAQGWQKWLIWFLIVTMNILLATNAVTTWKAACAREGMGDAYEAVLPGPCWRVEDSVLMAMVANAYSALVDFILALLPWKIIMSLQMKRHEKIGVAIAMSLGIIAGIVGVIKIVQITTIAGGDDIPYRLSLLFIWGQAEPNATIVAVSIPVLRVLFRDMHRTRYGGGGSGSHHIEGGGYLRSDARSKFHNGGSVSGGITLRTLEEGKTAHEMDDGSDRSILPGQVKGGIVRTREVAIEYDDERSRSREGGFDISDRKEKNAGSTLQRATSVKGVGRPF